MCAEHASTLLSALVAQDGSTTRLCEAIAGGEISLHVLGQRVANQMPAELRSFLKQHLQGTLFLERISSIAFRERVMTDNISYIALSSLPAELHAGLAEGKMPIGHLLSRQWVRRTILPRPPAILDRLWAEVGEPDEDATRFYRLDTAQGASMLIGEVFRLGMREPRPRSCTMK